MDSNVFLIQRLFFDLGSRQKILSQGSLTIFLPDLWPQLMCFISGWSLLNFLLSVQLFPLTLLVLMFCLKYVFWWRRNLQFSSIFFLHTSYFSVPGHKWDGAHRAARLAKCHDLCHSHLQVLWDLTSPSHPTCSCSTIRATQALLSSQQPLNPTVNCYTSLQSLATPQQNPSRCMSVLSI